MTSKGKQWVLLAAGSKGYVDYEMQADVCHTYQVMHQNGIPEEQIVVMMYDDIANNKDNPFPGNIINVPNGPNVYTGVLKDYTGEDVSADNFLAVLRGDSAAVKKKTGPKKVIQSDENDSIFVYLSGHGSKEMFHFPSSTLYAHDLKKTMNMMSQGRKFSKTVIYVDSCRSGSMLDQMSLSNVYAVSACKPDEKSQSCFYDKTRKAFLCGLFTFYWLQHMGVVPLNKTSFGDQFSYLEKKVSVAAKKTQTPCDYGDKGMKTLMLSELLGLRPASAKSEAVNIEVSDVVATDEIPLFILENGIKHEQDPEKRQALEKQYKDLKRKRKMMDEALQKISERANVSGAPSGKRDVTQTYEFKVVAEHFRTNLFNWDEEKFVVTCSHLQVLVNLCESGLEVETITEAITHVSQKTTF